MNRFLLPIPFVLYAHCAQGFDPRAVDVIGFRLGMTEAEVTAIADRQGFHDESFRRQGAPCPSTPDRLCVSTIEVRTKDGRMHFLFVPGVAGPTVERITYVFDGRKTNEPDALERAVIGRYGPPTSRGPMIWCDKRPGTGPCPPATPRLTFDLGVGSNRILTLSLH